MDFVEFMKDIFIPIIATSQLPVLFCMNALYTLIEKIPVNKNIALLDHTN